MTSLVMQVGMAAIHFKRDEGIEWKVKFYWKVSKGGRDGKYNFS